MPEPARPAEVTDVHTRLLKCALIVPESRAWWQHVDPTSRVHPAAQAFEEFWFGAKSQGRVKVLISNLRARYDAFPAALAVLKGWPDMDPESRTAICHWHLQLADPLYRAFAGDYLPERRMGARAEIRQDQVVSWVSQQGPGRWTMSTRIQFASKLLSCAFTAGLVAGRRDPRPLSFPRIPDPALGYLLHLLREVDYEGTMTDNPYLRSVGLESGVLEDRLRGLPELHYRRLGDHVDFGWRFGDLAAWAEARA
jgi:hypothetical protein